MIEASAHRASDLIDQMLMTFTLAAEAVDERLDHVIGEGRVGVAFFLGGQYLHCVRSNAAIKTVQQVLRKFDVEVG